MGGERGRADQVLVRPARSQDLSAVLALYHELADHRPDALPAPASIAREILYDIGTQRDRALLVATVADRVVATADLLLVANVTHGGRSWGIVENVVVEPGVRRRGVGRALMHDILRRCTDAGCYKVQLLSRKDRGGAHAFYRQMGFEAVAEGFRIYLS